MSTPRATASTGRPACRRPSDSAAGRPAACGTHSPSISNIAACALADRQPADGVAVEADLDQRARRLSSRRPRRSSPAGCRTAPGPAASPKARLAARGPAQRQRASASARALLGAGTAYAFVELHDDVGAEQVAWISIERSGVSAWREPSMCDLEGHALLARPCGAWPAHHLEAAGIGQDRPRPAHEPVQAAERRDPLGARRAASDDRCCRARCRRRSRAPGRRSSP